MLNSVILNRYIIYFIKDKKKKVRKIFVGNIKCGKEKLLD